jgi:hypothetical protein
MLQFKKTLTSNHLYTEEWPEQEGSRNHSLQEIGVIKGHGWPMVRRLRVEYYNYLQTFDRFLCLLWRWMTHNLLLTMIKVWTFANDLLLYKPERGHCYQATLSFAVWYFLELSKGIVTRIASYLYYLYSHTFASHLPKAKIQEYKRTNICNCRTNE